MVTSTVFPTRLVQIFSKFFIRCSWTSELCGTGAPVSPSSSPLSSLSLSEESERGVANVHCLSPFEWCLLCFPEAFAMWGIDFAVSRVITLQLNASTNFQTCFSHDKLWRLKSGFRANVRNVLKLWEPSLLCRDKVGEFPQEISNKPPNLSFQSTFVLWKDKKTWKH